jgi:hypothetical protein
MTSERHISMQVYYSYCLSFLSMHSDVGWRVPSPRRACVPRRARATSVRSSQGHFLLSKRLNRAARVTARSQSDCLSINDAARMDARMRDTAKG